MSTKKLLLFLLAVAFAITCTVHAQTLNGSVTAINFPGDLGSDTSSSLTMFETNVIQSTTGDFTSLVPAGSLLSTYTFFDTVSGLSSPPLTDPINNFFVFSVRANASGNGTTPVNRFHFNLQTITEDSFANGIGDFSGIGTIVDNGGVYNNTLADFTLDFNGSSPNSYSFTITTVPEPATISLVALGLAGAVVLRRRQA